MPRGNLRENILVSTGNRVAVVINGVEIGLCQSARCSDNYNLQAASGIGDIHVQEWVPTMATHQVTAQTMILFKNELGGTGATAGAVSSLRGALSVDNGDVMDNGDTVLRGLVFDLHISGKKPSNRSSNNGGSVTGARIGSRVTDEEYYRPIRVYYDCTFESGDIDVTKHQIIVSNAVFRALDVTSYPDNPDQLQASEFQR